MNTRPLVTVVIGVYNGASYIAGALDSVLKQTYSKVEIIVVDDASTDETSEILREYGDSIKVIRRSHNSATCELPRYQGVKAAAGEYCAFLDVDDRWQSSKLARQVTALEQYPEMVLCHTYAEIIDDKGCPKGIRHEGKLPESGRCARELLDHCFITISSVMVRRRAWLDAIAEHDLMYFGMDWDFFLVLAKEYPFCLLNEPLTQYRKAAGAVSYQKWRRLPRNIFTMERFREKELWRGLVTFKEYNRILLNAYKDNCEYHCYSTRPWRALYFCWRGIKCCPVNGWIVKSLFRSLFRSGIAVVAKL